METMRVERELVGVTLAATPGARYVVDSPRRAPQSFDCFRSAELAFNAEVFAVLGAMPHVTAPH